MAVTFALSFGSFGDIVLVIQLAIMLIVLGRRFWAWEENYNQLSRETERIQAAFDVVFKDFASLATSLGLPASTDMAEKVQKLGSVHVSKSQEDSDSERSPSNPTSLAEEGVDSSGGARSYHSTSKVRVCRVAIQFPWRLGRRRSSKEVKELRDELYFKRQTAQIFTYIQGLASMLSATPKLSKGNSVRLVDALGETKLIPIQYCFSFENFDSYVKRHFTGRIGENYVKRGDYTLTLNDLEVQNELWSSYVRCGVEFVMSIVIHQHDIGGRIKATCPRCFTVNSSPGTRENTFLVCKRCGGKFWENEVKTTPGELASEDRNEQSTPLFHSPQELAFFRSVKVSITKVEHPLSGRSPDYDQWDDLIWNTVMEMRASQSGAFVRFTNISNLNAETNSSAPNSQEA